MHMCLEDVNCNPSTRTTSLSFSLMLHTPSRLYSDLLVRTSFLPLVAGFFMAGSGCGSADDLEAGRFSTPFDLRTADVPDVSTFALALPLAFTFGLGVFLAFVGSRVQESISFPHLLPWPDASLPPSLQPKARGQEFFHRPTVHPLQLELPSLQLMAKKYVQGGLILEAQVQRFTMSCRVGCNLLMTPSGMYHPWLQES